MALTLDDLKDQVRQTETIDDAILTRLLSVATGHVERWIGYSLTDTAELPDGPPADLEHAVLMLAAHLYENREASLIGLNAADLPFGTADIIRQYRKWSWSDGV